MKKTLLFAFVLFLTTGLSAQYQLPNGGFEQWDGSQVDAEPSHWNSFATADGSMASMASSPHHYRRSGGRPGTSGSKYLTIYTKSILGVKANGNMTTGRIHAGAMSASSSENYNYTQRSNANHCQPFKGTPDSMYVWVSFYASSASSQAQVSAFIHGNNDFRSPNNEGDATLYCGKAVSRFTRTTTSASSMQWQQIKVPFVYDGSSSANYILLYFTTNYTPGAGSANDSLSIDDIVFIYSAWLNGASIGGEPVPDFDKGQLEYTLRVADTNVLLHSEVTAVCEASDAWYTVERQRVDDTTVTVVINVTAEDSVTTKEYRITLTTGSPSGGGELAISSVDGGSPQLAVYPNPATEVLTVQAVGDVMLCDLSGRTLLTRKSLGQTRFDLASLPTGAYIVRSGEATARVVKL